MWPVPDNITENSWTAGVKPTYQLQRSRTRRPVSHSWSHNDPVQAPSASPTCCGAWDWSRERAIVNLPFVVPASASLSEESAGQSKEIC